MADTGEKVYVADKVTLDEVKAILGSYAEGETAETVLEKLTTIIENTDEVESGIKSIAPAMDISNFREILGSIITTSADTEKTVLSVTGKGRFYGAFVSVLSGYQKYIKININIDGDIRTMILDNTSSSNGRKSIAIGSRDCISGSESSFLSMFGTLVYSGNIPGNSIFYTNYGSVSKMGSAAACALFCILEDYIEFNESLAISVKTEGQAGYGGGFYMLTE